VYITVTHLQLTNPTALAKETSGPISSKVTLIKLLTGGNEKHTVIKLLIQNFLIYQDKSSEIMVKI
jgi:hypothetical protein